MHWYETTSRILLILSIVNFALAAPVAVRDIHELQTHGADRRTSVARSPVDPDYTDDWLAQSKGSNNPPSSPESPSESDGGHWQSPEYVISSSQGDWSPERTVSEQWLPVVNGPDIYPASPESVDGPLRSPPPLSPTPSIGSASPPDGHPPPTPGPDVNPPPSSELQRPAEQESESFLDMLLNGKIRRHISGPVAVHATQRQLQDTVDPTLRDLAKNVDSLATSATSGVVGRGADMPLSSP
ncbi:hypothetical protein BGY98DRAFT_1097311 [Russula aff. rugulosa BPL654]|nr:hypothetical protein BGY98DRAFT_1097311 [Russula aff. rugulosa BPL654]